MNKNIYFLLIKKLGGLKLGYDNDNKEENDDYIPSDEEGFEFVNKVEDEWIKSLKGDLGFGKSLYNGLKS